MSFMQRSEIVMTKANDTSVSHSGSERTRVGNLLGRKLLE